MGVGRIEEGLSLFPGFSWGLWCIGSNFMISLVRLFHGLGCMDMAFYDLQDVDNSRLRLNGWTKRYFKKSGPKFSSHHLAFIITNQYNQGRYHSALLHQSTSDDFNCPESSSSIHIKRYTDNLQVHKSVCAETCSDTFPCNTP